MQERRARRARGRGGCPPGRARRPAAPSRGTAADRRRGSRRAPVTTPPLSQTFSTSPASTAIDSAASAASAPHSTASSRRPPPLTRAARPPRRVRRRAPRDPRGGDSPARLEQFPRHGHDAPAASTAASPGRSAHGIPVSVMLNPSARAIASVSASYVQPVSAVERKTASAASARQSLKPQNRSRVGSRSTSRHRIPNERPKIRRRTGWRRLTSAPAASREPTTTSNSPASASIRGSAASDGAQSASQCSRSAPVASNMPRRTDAPLPRLRGLRSTRTRGSASALDLVGRPVRAGVVDHQDLVRHRRARRAPRGARAASRRSRRAPGTPAPPRRGRDWPRRAVYG